MVPVFDLSVEDQPEFFASGVLVHNCRVSHVGSLARLEDQLTTWDPATASGSPDRLDALVYAVTELMGAAPSTATPPRPVRSAPSWGF